MCVFVCVCLCLRSNIPLSPSERHSKHVVMHVQYLSARPCMSYVNTLNTSCGSLSEPQSYLKHVQNFDVTLVVMGMVVELGS